MRRTAALQSLWPEEGQEKPKPEELAAVEDEIRISGGRRANPKLVPQYFP